MFGNKAAAVHIDRAEVFTIYRHIGGDLAFFVNAAVGNGQRAAIERDDAAVAAAAG